MDEMDEIDANVKYFSYEGCLIAKHTRRTKILMNLILSSSSSLNPLQLCSITLRCR